MGGALLFAGDLHRDWVDFLSVYLSEDLTRDYSTHLEIRECWGVLSFQKDTRTDQCHAAQYVRTTFRHRTTCNKHLTIPWAIIILEDNDLHHNGKS